MLSDRDLHTLVCPADDPVKGCLVSEDVLFLQLIDVSDGVVGLKEPRVRADAGIDRVVCQKVYSM